MGEYLNRFLSLRCSGDVLNAVGRMHEPEKEISESMGIIKHLKPIALAEKMKYTVYDLCAGNDLTSILAVHMLPVQTAIAVDKKKRNGNYGLVKRFQYLEAGIEKISYSAGDDIILIAVHPCQTANIVIDIFNTRRNIKHLILMPCCNGSYQDVTGSNWLRESKKLNSYDLWTLHLANKIEHANVNIVTDKKVLSPKNNIIIAKRG